MAKTLIVSNRLPVSFCFKKQQFTPSSGGLVTAIKGIQSREPIYWLGSISDRVPKKKIQDLQARKSGKIRHIPLVIKNDLYDDYYNGFSNDVLWPLFHYEIELVSFNQLSWESYKKVNELFAREVVKNIKKDDMVWVHDFHLLLLPAMIKRLKPSVKVGFFLHIPFPSSEIYKQLPVREEILRSLIQADLVGFHDYSYLRHFSSSVYNVLGVNHSLLSIQLENHTCQLGVYPVSIDTPGFVKKSQTQLVKKYYQYYGKHRKYQLILGVDRLDYIKGIELKLKSFDCLLANNPSLVGKVQLLQIAVPSRTEVEEYIHLKEEIDRLVGKINGKYSTPNYVPIQYLFTGVPVEQLLALYKSAEVLFITSKRDGMNLVCLEYIATQDPKKPGVVVLSEFAGAITTLSHALPINPWDIERTSRQLFQALSMSKEEKKQRHRPMLDFLQSYTATDWARSFLSGLSKQSVDSHSIYCEKIDRQKIPASLKKKIKNKHLLIVLDYDGTIVPIVQDPEQAMAKKRDLDILARLNKKNNIRVCMVSGRASHFIKKQFDGFSLDIAAEHGAEFYGRDKKRLRTLVNTSPSSWLREAHQIMKSYQLRTPQSSIEVKNYALVWHYRQSPLDFGEFQARKLFEELEYSLVKYPVSVNHGKKIIEVKSMEANKGVFLNWYFKNIIRDEKTVIIAIGDDITDEDMFAQLRDCDVGIKVGPQKSRATYRIIEQQNVLDIVQMICHLG